MNIVNRVVVILAILVVMIVIPLALIFPEQAYYGLQWATETVKVNLEWLDGLEPAMRIGVRILLAAAGLAVFVVGLLCLALEVIRIRRSTVRLRDGSGELVMSGVAGHLTYYVDLLPDVLRVRPAVQRAGNGVRATIDVETAPGVHVPSKSSEIRETARRVLEEELGLQVKGDIKVVIKPASPPKGGGSRRVTPAARPVQAAPAIATTPASPPVEAVETPQEEAPLPAQREELGKESETIEVKAPPDPKGLDATQNP